MPEQQDPLTIIAFDFGLRRIGVAVGQTITGSASPLGVIRNGDNGPDFDRVATLIREWRPDRLVVGEPTLADGGPSELEPTIQVFVAALQRFGLPVDRVDERHTSQEAEKTLKDARQAGSLGRIRKDQVDAAAAVFIAERYLLKKL